MYEHECEQGSEEWHRLRAGLPTASEFSKLVTSTGAESKSMPKYAVTLANELYAGKPLDAFAGNAWTENGNAVEDEARKYYAFVYGVEPRQVGFVTDRKDNPTYGISPDSLIGERGGLEIKCLKAETHTETLLYYKQYGRCPTKYVPQVQGQIMGLKLDWNDLLFYHPDLPSLVIRNEPNMKVILPLKKQIIAVRKERDEIFKVLKEFAAGGAYEKIM